MVQQTADPKLIESMAMRYRHDFGMLDEQQKEVIRITMRQLWEEVVGLGFYKPATPVKSSVTAVEWFNQQLVDRQNGNGDSRSWDEIYEKAKQIENEQLNIARIDGINLANKGYGSKGNDVPELRYKDGSPMRKYNSPKLQELEQINQDNPITRGSTALVKVTSSKTEISDEEIEKEVNEIFDKGSDYIMHPQYEMRRCFIQAIKWYREQLKKKK